MIKSFLKKVFSSSSSEAAATAEQSAVEDPIAAQAAEEQTGPEEGASPSVKVITLTKEWVERHSLKETEQVVSHLYEVTQNSPLQDPPRMRLEVDQCLLDPDALTSKRISKYLMKAELEIADFTFFLDKFDPGTMELYQAYLVPQRVDDLNSFLQERCFMIYDTCLGLSLDYKQEIESFFRALDIPMGPEFFQEFDQWREEILSSHESASQGDALGRDLHKESAEIVMIKISKEEVENENTQEIDKYMKLALQSPETAKAYRGTLLFSFYGFSQNDDLLALMNKKEINDWASLLVEQHPYIFYFLNDDEYPMTQFLTSLVVSTEVEDQEVYFNEEELQSFKEYISESLQKLASWMGDDPEPVLHKFVRHFS